MGTPKPHPHAELIKAWADGAAIQFRLKGTDGKWRDCPNPIWMHDYEYRIKPEETANKQWKPGENEDFWLVGYDGGVYFSAALPNLNRKAVENGNCFRTKAEALAAAERVRAALKGENYERIEWTKFDPQDPTTFPPVGGFLGYFDNYFGSEFQGVCFRETEDTDDAFATHEIYPGLTHWRPLPPPPGKEEDDA